MTDRHPGCNIVCMNFLPAPQNLGGPITDSMSAWYKYKTGQAPYFCPTDHGVIFPQQCVPRFAPTTSFDMACIPDGQKSSRPCTVTSPGDFDVDGSGMQTIIRPKTPATALAYRQLQTALNSFNAKWKLKTPQITVDGILGSDTFTALRYAFFAMNNYPDTSNITDLAETYSTLVFWNGHKEGYDDDVSPALFHQWALESVACNPYAMVTILQTSPPAVTDFTLAGDSGPLGLYDHEKGFVYVGVGVAVAIAAVVGGVILYRRSKR